MYLLYNNLAKRGQLLCNSVAHDFTYMSPISGMSIHELETRTEKFWRPLWELWMLESMRWLSLQVLTLI